ncbi:hypothetical protein FB45DRAFT_1065343 [Roridomyces roridus]|uniref:Uncharacterized protein n=1 Tax=Roridomyces roridus TaxID=1738132 RepID=A0AAD7B7T0_9AGAR|nr:hypothetical protein FB45DRAFT_1065343 [Roridomyces roridus]
MHRCLGVPELVSFDATVVPESHGELLLEGLVYLDVESSPIGDPVRAGQYLRAFFPKLRRIETLHGMLLDAAYELGAGVAPGILESHVGWKKVETVLRGGDIKNL